MKKVFSLLAVLALVAMASSVWAMPDPQTAYAEFATEEVSITVDLYSLPDTWSENFYQNVSGDGVSRIEFQFDNTFSLGNPTEYKAQGNVFAKIKTNLASMSDNKKLFMYTKNMDNSSATGYKVYGNGNRRTEDWGGGITVKACNGLIRKDGKATTDPGTASSDYRNDGDYAPIAVQFIKAIDADANGKQYSKANYPDVFTQDGYKGLKDLLDASDEVTAGTVNIRDKQMIGISGAGGGIWVGQDWYAGNSDVIAFFGAKFSCVVGGDKYQTNTITFEYATE